VPLPLPLPLPLPSEEELLPAVGLPVGLSLVEAEGLA
jgi:hypothetical protein